MLTQREAFDEAVSIEISNGLVWNKNGTESLGAVLTKDHRDNVTNFLTVGFKNGYIATKKQWNDEDLAKYVKALINDNLAKRWEYNKSLKPKEKKVKKSAKSDVLNKLAQELIEDNNGVQ
jgi:hypothetical protein